MSKDAEFRAYPLTPTKDDGVSVDEAGLCESIDEFIVFEKSGIRAIHTALGIVGRSAGAPRRPIRMLGEEDRSALEKLLRSCEDLISWKS